MIGIVVLTHGLFGEDLLKTASGIMNDSEKVMALNLSRRLDFSALRLQVSNAIDQLGVNGGVLVLVDAYGGTSYNTAIPLMKDRSICLVTGVSLPMVLSALSHRHRMPLGELSKKVSDDAKKTISICSNCPPHAELKD